MDAAGMIGEQFIGSIRVDDTMMRKGMVAITPKSVFILTTARFS